MRGAEATREELLTAEAQPQATDEHRRMVAEADAAGWPQLHAEREELRQRQLARTPEIRGLERRHDELLQQQERMARDCEREIIGQARLVATTLARFRLHPAVNAAPFDIVLVDEVGAATLAEVLVPVAAARQTAVLLGDFLQLGPVLKDEVRDSPNPLVQLREAATTVVQMQRMHQKIVVVDEHTVMYGSVNTLSSQRQREIMVIHRGADFAAKLLEHEHADVFARPPKCGRCGEQAALRRSESVVQARPWLWRCGRRCGWEEPVRLSGERRPQAGGAA